MDDSTKKKYLVSAEMTISVHVLVDAYTEEEALELANDADLQTDLPITDPLSELDSVWETSGELDGAPIKPFVVEEL